MSTALNQATPLQLAGAGQPSAQALAHSQAQVARLQDRVDAQGPARVQARLRLRRSRHSNSGDDRSGDSNSEDELGPVVGRGV